MPGAMVLLVSASTKLPAWYRIGRVYGESGRRVS